MRNSASRTFDFEYFIYQTGNTNARVTKKNTINNPCRKKRGCKNQRFNQSFSHIPLTKHRTQPKRLRPINITYAASVLLISS